MDREILSIESAEKLANYEKLLLEKQNVIRYIKNQISVNKKNFEKHRLLNNKEQMIVARSKISLAQEILFILNNK